MARSLNAYLSGWKGCQCVFGWILDREKALKFLYFFQFLFMNEVAILQNQRKTVKVFHERFQDLNPN